MQYAVLTTYKKRHRCWRLRLRLGKLEIRPVKFVCDFVFVHCDVMMRKILLHLWMWATHPDCRWRSKLFFPDSFETTPSWPVSLKSKLGQRFFTSFFCSFMHGLFYQKVFCTGRKNRIFCTTHSKKWSSKGKKCFQLETTAILKEKG